jgi:A/G-specific adenine glycosylase
MKIEQFRGDLAGWFAQHQRDLPWRRTGDPYAILISEIMLQQTRVAAVIPYYERFLARFPTFHALAGAPESELLACWAGLGYYYRARNLQRAAQLVCHAGAFPANFDDLRRLPGIGDYTAAAVASIGFDLPHAVLDGNVFRVLSRVFDDDTNIASGTARRHFSVLADKLLDRDRPGVFNQAMMELGATICLPRSPQCLICPVSTHCRARQNGRQNQLPVKILAQKSVAEERVLFWTEREGRLLVWQRPVGSRLMPGFWELPEREQLPDVTPECVLGTFRHGITFHNYRFEIRRCEPPAEVGICQWIEIQELIALPVSTILQKARRTVERYRKRVETPRMAAASG